jgi:hypothetical protein
MTRQRPAHDAGFFSTGTAYAKLAFKWNPPHCRAMERHPARPAAQAVQKKHLAAP